MSDYAATVLWALTGIVVNQYAYSAVTTGTALAAAVAVVLVLLVVLRGGCRGGGARRAPKPRTA